MELLPRCTGLCLSRNMYLTLLVVLLSYLAAVSHGCSCKYEHPQTHYCKADFAIKAKVLSSRNIYDTPDTPEPQPPHITHVAYKLHIKRKFKGEELLSKLNNTNEIYTVPYGSLCGRVLSADTKYLIIGYIDKDEHDKGVMSVSLCDYVKEWSKVTVRLRKSVAFNFDRNCECQVKTCYSHNCHKKRAGSTCQFETRAKFAECYENHAYCQLKTQGKCKWSRNSVTVKCVQSSKKRYADKYWASNEN